jgi:hypothetical protein
MSLLMPEFPVEDRKKLPLYSMIQDKPPLDHAGVVGGLLGKVVPATYRCYNRPTEAAEAALQIMANEVVGKDFPDEDSQFGAFFLAFFPGMSLQQWLDHDHLSFRQFLEYNTPSIDAAVRSSSGMAPLILRFATSGNYAIFAESAPGKTDRVRGCDTIRTLKQAIIWCVSYYFLLNVSWSQHDAEVRTFLQVIDHFVLGNPRKAPSWPALSKDLIHKIAVAATKINY